MYKNISKPHVFGEVFLSERLSSFINVMSSTSFACIVYLRLSQCTDKITTCGIFVQFTNVHILHTYVVSLTDEKMYTIKTLHMMTANARQKFYLLDSVNMTKQNYFEFKQFVNSIFILIEWLLLPNSWYFRFF